MKAVIGLTGGIGSGKTLIARVFEHLGISVFYSDSEAKSLYDNPMFLQEVASEFGEEIIFEGKLQKQRLAQIVFSDKTKLQRLNAMLHPKVMKLFSQWAQAQTSAYVIMESAIIFENNLQGYFDKIITIDTPKEIALRRVIARDRCSEQDALRRIENQMSQQEKNALADFVIQHDERTMLLPQILDIHSEILKL